MPTWWERGGEMPTIEERVAYLEGTVGEHTRVFADLQHGIADQRTGLTELRRDMNTGLTQLRHDITSGLTELRSDMHARFAQVDQRFAQLFGTQLAVLLAVIAALAAAYYR